MIGGFCLQPLPGQVQGQLAGQPTLIAVNITATPSLSVANISEGAGRVGEAPVNYAFRMAPERSRKRTQWLDHCSIEECESWHGQNP